MAHIRSLTANIAGAGLGGLSAAIHLAAAGKKVIVFDRLAEVGGKLGTHVDRGYRFDTGPSLFTVPQLVDELLALVPEKDRPVFRYERLDEVTRYWWPDGTHFAVPAQPAAFAEVVQKHTGVPAKAILKRLDTAKANYESTGPLFIEKSLHKRSTYFSEAASKALRVLPTLGLMQSMHKANVASFGDARIVQYFDRYATYNGSNPYKAPATLNMIAHLEHQLGVYYPKGGMQQIALVLRQAAEALGVRFELGQEVTRVLTQRGICKGIRAGGFDRLSDAVVCNMDIRMVNKKLLPERYREAKAENAEPSSSAIIFYWGVRGNHKALGLHNVLFSGNYKAEFDSLEEGRSVYQDPTVYINISSKLDPADAPAGCENWFVMVNAPHKRGQDWKRIVAETRSAVLAKIKSTTGIEVSPLIETEHMLDPGGIENATGSYGGSLYGASSNSMNSAFMRHPNYSRSLERLFFCGGSVHPGGGIPLVLQSGKIASKLALEAMNESY